jgi:hypothetical protein
MADPKLLVDHRDEIDNFRTPPLRNLKVEGAGEMQRFDIAHPSE